MPKTALITGITGQDGSYLAELLLSKGYAVHGVVRPTTRVPTWISLLEDKLHLHAFDLQSTGSMGDLISTVHFDEVYHLASPSFVPQSWDDPLQNLLVTAADNNRNPRCSAEFTPSSSSLLRR